MSTNKLGIGLEGRLRLPLGIDDYIEATTQRYYYVDKTLLIRDFLDTHGKVTLFTRPRRFGKSLNMSMLKVFFEDTGSDTSGYFADKKIWSCGAAYQAFQGRYPLIFVSFKDAGNTSWADAHSRIIQELQREYDRVLAPVDLGRIRPFKARYVERFMNGEIIHSEAQDALRMLSAILEEYYDSPVVILIDEYDTPIQTGYAYKYYDHATNFTRGLLSDAIKGNTALEFACLTGVTCIAQKGFFSGLNNVDVRSVLDRQYRDYFGFTPEEVQHMAEYYGVSHKLGEIHDWYNGYHFAGQDIYNPWSVIKYFGDGCVPKPYWVYTGGYDALRDTLHRADRFTKDGLRKLLEGDSIVAVIDPDVAYPNLAQNESAVWTLLLTAGYLTPLQEVFEEGYEGEDEYELIIPNKEIRRAYRKEVLASLGNGTLSAIFRRFRGAVLSGKAARIQEVLRELLVSSVSCFDTVEAFYHGLVLGLCASMEEFLVRSNREAGTGRYDLCLFPRDIRRPGVIFEFKSVEKGDSKTLIQLAEEAALSQIEDRDYDRDLKDAGITTVYKFGAAFSGKDVAVVSADDLP